MIKSWDYEIFSTTFVKQSKYIENDKKIKTEKYHMTESKTKKCNIGMCRAGMWKRIFHFSIQSCKRFHS